jgi:hypothetical protein
MNIQLFEDGSLQKAAILQADRRSEYDGKCFVHYHKGMCWVRTAEEMERYEPLPEGAELIYETGD